MNLPHIKASLAGRIDQWFDDVPSDAAMLDHCLVNAETAHHQLIEAKGLLATARLLIEHTS